MFFCGLFRGSFWGWVCLIHRVINRDCEWRLGWYIGWLIGWYMGWLLEGIGMIHGMVIWKFDDLILWKKCWAKTKFKEQILFDFLNDFFMISLHSGYVFSWSHFCLLISIWFCYVFVMISLHFLFLRFFFFNVSFFNDCSETCLCFLYKNIIKDQTIKWFKKQNKTKKNINISLKNKQNH